MPVSKEQACNYGIPRSIKRVWHDSLCTVHGGTCIFTTHQSLETHHVTTHACPEHAQLWKVSAHSFTTHRVAAKDFERLVRDADAACNNESAPQLVDIYARAQAEVVENGSVQLVQDEFCNFGSSPTPAAMANYTSNLFVLCQVCQELQPRPAACPWPELCLCRDAMMQVALSAVYIHCPQRNAFVDPWHRWVTAITSCLLEDPQAAQWYNSSQLQQHLQTI